jgi:hypothetical protein
MVYRGMGCRAEPVPRYELSIRSWQELLDLYLVRTGKMDPVIFYRRAPKV